MRADNPLPGMAAILGRDPEPPVCTPVSLPPGAVLAAAARAIEINPQNRPEVAALAALDESLPGVLREIDTPYHLAVITKKTWPADSVVSVAFLDAPGEDLANRILSHMNAWYKGGVNVRFVRSTQAPTIRITRGGSGYWSYLGTDNLSISSPEPTMCLQGFTMNTPESEFTRVVRHETGHPLGFPHEHSRREAVALLDPAKTIAYFKETQGWSEAMIRAQILTPLDERSVMGTPDAERDSIMCYQFPGKVTKSGEPIVGGSDITVTDYAYGRKVYPGGPTLSTDAGTVQVRGSIGAGGTPFILFVVREDGGPERGYGFRGKIWTSPRDGKTLVFKGPAMLITPDAAPLVLELIDTEAPP